MICEKMPAPGVAGRGAGDKQLRRSSPTISDAGTQPAEPIIAACVRAIRGGNVERAKQLAALAAHEAVRAKQTMKQREVA